MRCQRGIDVRMRAALSFVGLAAAGCGAPLDLPQEPDTAGNPLGEIAYVRKYDPWEGLGKIDDLVFMSSVRGLLYGVQDSTRVTAWASDTKLPRVNPLFNIPEVVIVKGDTVRVPVRICEGARKTLWVAYRSPHPILVQWNLDASTTNQVAQVDSGLVRDDSIQVFGGIAADPDSDFVYVADAGRSRITKYAPSAAGGRQVVILATPGSGDRFVQEPHGIFFFQDSLLVADTGKGWLQVLDADVPTTGRGQVTGPAESQLVLRRPLDVWVDDSGFYYVTDTGNSRVLKLDVSGAIKEIVNEFDVDPAVSPNTLAATTEDVWVVDPDRGRLTTYRINTAAKVQP